MKPPVTNSYRLETDTPDALSLGMVHLHYRTSMRTLLTFILHPF